MTSTDNQCLRLFHSQCLVAGSFSPQAVTVAQYAAYISFDDQKEAKNSLQRPTTQRIQPDACMIMVIVQCEYSRDTNPWFRAHESAPRMHQRTQSTPYQVRRPKINANRISCTLNSSFKVLFIFPSQYFCAIGL